MLLQLKNVNERYLIFIFTSRTMCSELCISRECSVSQTQGTCVAYWQVALMCGAITCEYFSTANPPLILHPIPLHTSHTSSLCASYLFILFSASIPLPLAQVSTLLLSHRLMIRALLCLSLFFSLVTPPFLLLLSPTLSKFCPFDSHAKHYLTNLQRE